VKTAPSNRQVVDFAQVAALPLLVGDDGVARVLLLTSRETKRWVIPKGWPMKGRKPYEAAAQEALEEAGVSGRAWKKPVGAYSYFKRRDRHFDICQVDVYLLRVEKQLKTWAGGAPARSRPHRSRQGLPRTDRAKWNDFRSKRSSLIHRSAMRTMAQ
jgi:8-oxo-dGTP pyrophosphatase MutT (NUDIX family)